jgi:hypothetical protein
MTTTPAAFLLFQVMDQLLNIPFFPPALAPASNWPAVSPPLPPEPSTDRGWLHYVDAEFERTAQLVLIPADRQVNAGG